MSRAFALTFILGVLFCQSAACKKEEAVPCSEGLACRECREVSSPIAGQWSSPERLSIDGSMAQEHPFAIASDSNGNVFLIQNRDEQTWLDRYHPSQGWTAVRSLGAADTSADIAFNRRGEGMVVWHSENGPILSARFSSGAWSDEELVAEEIAGAIPLVGLDANGNAIVAWVNMTGYLLGDVWATHQALGEDWEVPERISNEDESASIIPQLAVAPSGHAVAGWLRYTFDGEGERGDVWSNVYSPDAGC